jgi:subtilisin-like proprotein convertase family protein
MRPNSRKLIGLLIALAVAVALVWKFNRAPRAEQAAGDAPAVPPIALQFSNLAPAQAAPVAPVVPSRFDVVATNVPNAPFTNLFAYRLTNSLLPFEELLRSDFSVLLRNALIDTRRGAPAIPAHLRAAGDPGAYIVQARGLITDEFRNELQRAGAEIVSYVPNNAYLVRATAGEARALGGSPLTQSVLPFEPYYKLDARLLALAVNQQLSPHALLNVVTFPGGAAEARTALEQKGVRIVTEAEPTVFGDVLVVKAGADQLSTIAQMSDVQMLGVHFEKRLMNDLARPLINISTNIPLSTNVPIVRPPNNYYSNDVTLRNLTGEGVMLAVADSGVDETHPDFAGRVTTIAGPDFDGHGTHVVGTILGDGTQSPLPGPTNAMGSLTNAVFSGMAPRARAFVQDYTLPDTIMQRNTGQSNALISNNSWGRPGANDYDIYAASFDAAVRDSLPGVTGEQQVAYVFAAGNEGGGGDNGLNGIPGSIASPATAKNVITVGASDLPRFITNQVSRACVTDTNTGVTTCETNMPWYGMTDTNNQVSPYSSRGNVGIGQEGFSGRFKPDVVAPGSMLVSTRSRHYIDPDGITNTTPFTYNGLTVAFNRTNLYALNIPANAVSVTILTLTNFLSPTNLTLDVAADIDVVPNPGLTGTNTVTLNTNTPAIRAGTLYYTVANKFHTNTTVSYDLVVLLTTTNDQGDFYTVLKDMNAPLKVGNQGYRYEAGTSMAAPAVSGFLALIQEFLGTNNLRPSPALLKAMLINGARSLSPNYNLQVSAPVNHQGWGLVNMSNSLPAGFNLLGTNGPMRIYDQTLTNALATGGVETYEITVPNTARSFPLRVTLVWTDPPGNPITGVKLVNDMNLSVVAGVSNALGTNTAEWLGNNFGSGANFVEPVTVASNGNPVSAAAQVDLSRDFVNNVENVFIRPPLASKYTVVVKAHRVNVNAVNSHTNRHAQDYALVISSGNFAPSNNVNLVVTGPVFTNDVNLRRFAELVPTPINTNGPISSQSAGLINQRVGANNPLIVSTNGATNQWCFFTYTNVNDASFTNVVILTFLPPNLSLPRNREADIDMFVARGPNAFNLTNRDEGLIDASLRSVGRGGTEYVYLNNAQAGEVFYIGIKSEDQQAANFSIYAESRNGPFSSRDGDGNIIVNAIGPVEIPDGTPEDPGGTNMLLFVVDPRDLQTVIQRVYLTNSIYHEEAGDLIGILSRPGGTNAVTLNNHRTWTGFETPQGFVIYDDSEQGDLDSFLPTPIAPDGPGRLRDFVGEQAGPVWNFTVSDNALFHTGSVNSLTLHIEPASTNNADPNVVVDRRFCIGAGRWVYVPVNIGFDVVNMETCLSDFESTPASPIQVYIRQGGFPDNVIYDHFFERLPPGDPCFDLGLGDNPPLTPGRWYIGMFNPNPDSVCLHLRVTLTRQNIPGPYSIFTSTNTPKTLLDDATTNSTIFISQTGRIADLRVGLRVAHDRASDLAFHLRSPRGTRVLLMENRGRTNGLGIGANLTNVVTNIGPVLLENGFDDAEGSGTGSRVGANVPYHVGEFISGWRVDAENIEVVHDSYGMLTNRSHTGTNAVDLNGLTGPGAISRTLATVSNKTYRVSFAFCKNPGGGSQQAAIRIQSVDILNFNYALANSYFNLNWQTTSVVFRATSTNTLIGFRQVSPAGGTTGMFLDSVRVEEYSVTTNLFLYTTFTENTNLTITPIKFGIPPFTNSPNPSLGFVLNDGFEFLSPYVQGSPFNLPAGTPALNTDISGWHVDDDDVDVLSSFIGYGISDSGDYFLDINGFQPGQISTNVTTEIGADYELRFAYRRNPGATSASPVAQVRVIGASATELTNMVISPMDFNVWSNATLSFRANSAVSRVEVEGLSPLNENGVFFDSFTMRKSNLDAALQSYFLPEELMTPLFGESAFGPWTLEVWDSRLGPSSGSLSNVLISWKLEIAFPVVNPPFISITNPSQSIITNVVGDEVVYFAVDLPCFSGVVTNTLRNITGAGGLDLIFNQFTLPTNGPNDVLLLNDVTGTESNILTIGSPPLVSLNRYYLAVRNTNPGQSNQFELRVDFACSTTNTFPLLTTNSYCTNIIAAPSVDYYRYQMPSNVLAVRFETYGADGNVDMAVQANGVPSTSSGLQSTQPGRVNELVQVMTNYPPSNPVNPTIWYIAIRNQDAATVNYCLKITEIYDITPLTLNVGLGQTIQSNDIQYYVLNIDSNYCGVFFNSTNHNLPVNLLHYINYGRLPSTLDYTYSGTAVPGGIPRAIGPLPTNYPGGEWFIEVVNTNAVAVNYTMLVSTNSCSAPFAPIIKVDVSSYSTNGFLLRWDAPISEQYQVQYTDSLLPANWQTIPGIVTSGTGSFIYTNIGAMTNAQRFYRLLRVP